MAPAKIVAAIVSSLVALILLQLALILRQDTCDSARLRELIPANYKLTYPNIWNLKMLNRTSNNLAQLPEAIGCLKQLEVLDLSYNQLTSLPERISDLTQLKELDLSYNNLTSLPERIGDLAQLESLSLRDNQLESLPRSIEKLANTTLLDLTNNPLVEYEEDGTLGWRELKEKFGDRVRLSQCWTEHPGVPAL